MRDFRVDTHISVEDRDRSVGVIGTSLIHEIPSRLDGVENDDRTTDNVRVNNIPW